MISTKRAALLGVAIFLSGAGANLAYSQLLDPLAAVRAAAVDAGWSTDELVPVEGGYSSRFLAWTAYGRFRVTDGSAAHEIFVRVNKPTPFHSWRLVELDRDPR